MKPGPPRKPEPLRELAGFPDHAPPRKNAPKPPSVAPDAPRGMSKAARVEWDRIVPLLERLGLLSQLDRAALASYCEAWSDFIRATRKVEREGLTIVTSNGNVIQNPALGVKNQAREAIRKLASEFGLSPAARAGLEVTPPALGAAKPSSDDASEFFTVVPGGRR